MNTSLALKISGALLIATFYIGTPATVYGADDHMKDASKGDGHDHGAKPGAEEHKKDGDGHDHAHESADDHSKHHPKPSHGGVVLEMGEHHGELVINDGKISLYMSNDDGKSEPGKGFSASVIVLTAQGRQGPVKLAASGDGKLVSADVVKTGPGARVIITLTDPHGHTAQARHQMP